MKYIIDTDTLKMIPYKETEEKKTLADIILPWVGTKEYDGVVADIQNWYYGFVSKTAWCATCVSYAAHLLGNPVEKYVGKFENVDLMKDHINKQGRLDCTKNYGGGAYTPVRGDLIFFSLKYSYKDCTHVGVVLEANPNTGNVTCISGNSSDMVKIDSYNYYTNKYVVAFGNMQN